MITKTVLYLLGVLVSLVVSNYFTMIHYKHRYSICKEKVQGLENEVSFYATKQDMLKKINELQTKLTKQKVVVQKATIKELKKKEDSGEDYEILATDRKHECGCILDANVGWVFK